MAKIDEFIKTSQVRLQSILDKFGWTAEGVLKDFNTNVKPINSETEATPSENEEPLFPPSITTRNSVVIGDVDLQRLLNDPAARISQKFSDLQLNFNREDKLLIYEHVVKQRTEIDRLSSQQDDIISFADIVTMKRLEKKKRRKHRTSKPSYVEELHGLLEIQMQALEEYFGTKNKIECNAESSAKGHKSERNSIRHTEKETHAICEKYLGQKSYESDRKITQNYDKSSYKSTPHSMNRETQNRRYTEERSRSDYKHAHRSHNDTHRHRYRSRSSSRHRHGNHDKHSNSRDRSKREHKEHRSRSRSRSRHRYQYRNHR